MGRSIEKEVPLWDLTSIYKGFDDPKFADDKDKLSKSLDKIKSVAGDKKSAKDNPSYWFKSAADTYNEAVDLLENLISYAYARFSTATGDKENIVQLGKIEDKEAELKTALVKLRNAMAEIKDELDDLIKTDEFVRDHEFFIKEQLYYQSKQMPPELEGLANELARSGAKSWSKLQEAASSSAKIVWDEKSGEEKTLVQLRGLAFNQSRDIREKAFNKELELWKSMEIPFSYSLNGVKGSAISLSKRRGYSDVMEKTLAQARISGKTLDSLIGAMEKGLPSFRDYFRAKAKLLGTKKLAFYDIFAPLKEGSREWSFEDAKSFILQQFYSFSDKLGNFAENAFLGGWIDARTREGKVGGAYCASFPLAGESRVLANFDGSFTALSAIAHELGHAYHHHVLKDGEAIDREYPMTLAETASIFCENIVFNQALKILENAEKISVLETYLQEAAQVIVDILSRFYFERSVFAKKAEGDLTAADFCDLMIAAQKAAYGDGLDENKLHPYMWAVKGHYYYPDLDFYNFPYAFGLLFGTGLYSQYIEKGNSFIADYDKILGRTGKTGAVTVAAEAGFDIEKEDFWTSALGFIEKRIMEFCELANSR